MDSSTATLLRELALRYETPAFLEGDPSSFMHKVQGDVNREVTAFVAAALSYGSRAQFLPKIQELLDSAEGDMYGWVKEGAFRSLLAHDDRSCFYRLYSKGLMNRFLSALQEMLAHYGSIGTFAEENTREGEAIGTISSFCRYFSERGLATIIPKDTASSCKRLCMFLRWMTRENSPVDLGLWKDFVSRRTLIMPLDTHVLTEAGKLGLTSSRCASMSAARKLTAQMAEVFPDDPLKGDFALFGLGVDGDAPIV